MNVPRSVWKRPSVIASLAVICTIAIGIATYAVLRHNMQPLDGNNEPQSAVGSSKALIQQQSYAVSAMGDMLAHDSVVNQARTTGGYDFTPYFSSITQLLTQSDVVFCNPETPTAGADFGISGYPTFNAPTEFARDLHKTGCNMINLASNHTTDRGQPAIDKTISVWEGLGPLAVTGANRSAEEQQSIQYFDMNGIKTAFLAFADFSNGPIPSSYSLNIYHDEALVRQLVTEAREQADAVIVSMHWGVEDSHDVSDDQRTAAALLANLGVDVIIGTGPHVLQPVEWVEGTSGYKTLTWYSIGNMLSSQLQVDELTGGVASFRITKSDDRIILSDISFRGTFMSYEWSEADKIASNLSGRSNLKLQPLSGAHAETQLFGVSVDERMQRVREWLGDSVEIDIQ